MTQIKPKTRTETKLTWSTADITDTPTSSPIALFNNSRKVRNTEIDRPLTDRLVVKHISNHVLSDVFYLLMTGHIL